MRDRTLWFLCLVWIGFTYVFLSYINEYLSLANIVVGIAIVFGLLGYIAIRFLELDMR